MRRPLSRREFMALGVGAAAWACAREPSEPKASPAGGELSTERVSTELAVGDDRFGFALFTSDRLPFEPPDVTGASVQLMPPGGAALAPLTARVEQISVSEGGESRAEVHKIFVVEHRFDTPGSWSLEAEVASGGRRRSGKLAFPVLERSDTVMRGEKAIASQTPTTSDPRGVNPICTRTPQCSMHDVTIAESLSAKKPLVAVFATPRYCTSRTCGPVVDIVENAKKEHGDAARFVHVEVWKSDESVDKELAPTFAEWKFVAEPWVFFIGADGLVKARWSGAVGADETKKAVAALVAGSL